MMYVRGACSVVYLQGLKKNLVVSVPSFYVHSRDQIQITSLGSKRLYLLRHLAYPSLLFDHHM